MREALLKIVGPTFYLLCEKPVLTWVQNLSEICFKNTYWYHPTSKCSCCCCTGVDDVVSWEAKLETVGEGHQIFTDIDPS